MHFTIKVDLTVNFLHYNCTIFIGCKCLESHLLYSHNISMLCSTLICHIILVTVAPSESK